MRYTPPPGSTDPDAPYVTGVPGVLRGSPVPAEAVEAPQREIVNAIMAAGLAPDGEDLTQLWQAIGRAITAAGPVLQLNSEMWITESGTFTASVAGWYAGHMFAGGFGATVGTLNKSVWGGFAGIQKTFFIYLTAGQKVPVVIGAGGKGSTVQNWDIQAGGNTSFGDVVAVNGPDSAEKRGEITDGIREVLGNRSECFGHGAGIGSIAGRSYVTTLSQDENNARNNAFGHFGAGGTALVTSTGQYAHGDGAQGSIYLCWHDPAKANGPAPASALLSARRMAPRAAAAPVTVNLYDPETGQGSVWREEDAEAKLAAGMITEAAWQEICAARAAEERAAWLVDPDTEAERYDLLRAARDAKLAATDYLTAADYPLADEARAEVTAYRQALRDLPAGDGAPWDGGGDATPWPEAPTLKKVEGAPEVEAVPEAQEAPAVEGAPGEVAGETAPESPEEA